MENMYKVSVTLKSGRKLTNFELVNAEVVNSFKQVLKENDGGYIQVATSKKVAYIFSSHEVSTIQVKEIS